MSLITIRLSKQSEWMRRKIKTIADKHGITFNKMIGIILNQGINSIEIAEELRNRRETEL